ncbi:hypothetical protein JOC75_002236 [Metabacillus crassostreae]|nr:hypothetical protein [Metabacillus crassostreae]
MMVDKNEYMVDKVKEMTCIIANGVKVNDNGR